MKCPECGRGDMKEVHWEGRMFYGCSTFNCKTSMSPKKHELYARTGQYEKAQKKTYPYREKSLTFGASWSSLIEGTQQQQAIWQKFGEGHSICINALAGTGKSTALIQASNRIAEHCKIIALSFAKRDQLVLAEKMPPNTSAVTVHSLGNRAIGRGHGFSYTVNKHKVRDILNDIYTRQITDGKELALVSSNIRNAAKLIGLCQTGLIPVPTDVDLDTLAAVHALEYNGQVNEMARLYMKNFALSRKHNLEYGIDFDDMLYIPVMENLLIDQADAVMVDEAQDLSPARRALALKVSDQVVIVGDSLQAIYRFAGADTHSIENMTTQMNNPLALELTVNWRCGTKHIELAKRIAPSLEGRPQASSGIVAEVTEEQFMQNVRVGHLVLSRDNKSMIPPVYALIRQGIAATITGRDFGEDLMDIIERLTSKTDVAIKEFLPKLEKYQDKLLDSLSKRRDADRLMANARDKTDTILALCAGHRSTQEVLNRIDSLFVEEGKAKTANFSTIHKAKGSENPNVHILNAPALGSTKSKNPDDIQEAKNLLYVALTRVHEQGPGTGVLSFIGGTPLVLGV